MPVVGASLGRRPIYADRAFRPAARNCDSEGFDDMLGSRAFNALTGRRIRWCWCMAANQESAVYSKTS
jgi:hypothetical protein